MRNLENIGSTSASSGGTCPLTDCSVLEEAWLPAKVSLLPFGTFQNCFSLKAVHTEGVIKQVGINAFYGCALLESFPEDGVTVTNLQSGAFSGCSSLKKIVLWSKLKTLSSSAFTGCTGLEEVVVEEGADNLNLAAVFKNCSGIKKATLPKLMTNIPKNMFEGCTSLTEINIPENLVSIGTMAFAYTNLGRVEIPTSLETLGTGAFVGCPNLELVIPADSSFVVGPKGEIYDASMTLLMVPAELSGEYTISNDVTIGSFAFAGCSKLTKINLPDSMTEIPAYAFAGIACVPEIVGNNLTGIANYAFYQAKFTSFTIPAWVDTIGEYAFAYSLIEKLTIPSSVTSIGRYAFGYCNNLVEVTVENGVESICGATTSTGYLFAYSKALSKVTLPNTLKEIGAYCFYSCTALARIDLPESLTTIRESAFRLSGLVSVYVPKNVTYMGNYSFASISTLTSIEFAEGIEAIGYENQGILGGYSGAVLYYCTALVDVKLPSTLRYIGVQTFYNCYSIEKLELPDGLICIGNSSLTYCQGIKQLVIPESVKIMGTKVFSNWTAEQTICFECSATQARLFSDVLTNIAATMVYDYVKPVQ